MDTSVTSNNIPVACFAPPLTDEELQRIENIIDSIPADVPNVKEVTYWLYRLLACVKSWWNLPESKRKDHRRWTAKDRHGGEYEYMEVPLEDAHVKSLWDVTPWMRELRAVHNPRPFEGGEPGLFDLLPQGDLKNVATTLLWHVIEITTDREPITQDKLIKV